VSEINQEITRKSARFGLPYSGIPS